MDINFFLTGLAVTGGVRCVCEHARHLQERGHRVRLIVSSYRTEPEFLPRVLVRRPGQIGLRMRRLLSRLAFEFHGLPRDLAAFFAGMSAELGAFYRLASRADVSVATAYQTAWPVYLCGQGAGFYFMQHLEELFAKAGATELIERSICRSTYSLPLYKVANSIWLQDQLKSRFGIEVPVVNNAVDTEEFKPWSVRRNTSMPRVVTFGKPVDWKGFEDAAAAMQIVRKKHTNVEWAVFGYLPRLRPDNDMAPYRFFGTLVGDELAKLYSSADVVLCPSWYESFPLPPLEAMACGAAVVTTRPGTEDYARNRENCLVVPARDVEGMAAAVEELIEDRNLRQRLGEAGYATAQGMSWASASAAFEAALFQAIAEANRSKAAVPQQRPTAGPVLEKLD